MAQDALALALAPVIWNLHRSHPETLACIISTPGGGITTKDAMLVDKPNQNKTDGPLHKAEKSETGDAKSAVLRTSPVVKEPIKESPGVAS